MIEPTLTLVGNLTADPTLRVTPKGDVANCRIAYTPRWSDRETAEIKIGTTLFVNVSCWRELGAHVRESVHKGDRVLVTGRLRQRDYVDKDGNPRIALELEAEAIGPELAFATAAVQRPNRKQVTATPDLVEGRELGEMLEEPADDAELREPVAA